MRERLMTWLLHLLRVPAEPAPPPGDPACVRRFRAAPSYFRYSVAVWGLKQLSALAGVLFSYFFFRTFVADRAPADWFVHFGVFEQLAVLALVAQLPFSFAILRLSFEMRWYILSDRSLRIRHGVLTVREQTMTFANIQNISTRQNPVQRLFGISSVVVRAAGGGSSQGKKGVDHSHEATFEGVDNAEQIRAVIRERIRGQRGAGLGDPDESALEIVGTGSPRPQAGTTLGPAIAAARRLLDEAARLRAAAS